MEKTDRIKRRPFRFPERRFGIFGRFLANLYQGLRAAIFLKVDNKAWRISVAQLAALFVFLTLIKIGLQWTLRDGPTAFNWFALRALGFDLVLFLLAGSLALRFGRRTFDLLTVPIAVYAITVFLFLFHTASQHTSLLWWGTSLGTWISLGGHYAYYVWMVAAAVVLLYRLAKPTPHALATAALPVIAFAVFSLVTPPAPYWYRLPPDESAAAKSADSPVAEEMLYLQPRLLRDTLAKIDEQRAGVPDVYFVGFAPFGEEDVFMKESEVIRQLMDERFDTRSRSALLINNNQTLRKYPLATITNLRAVLDRVGEQMDPRDDVLVLYLTSHGSQDHRLSAQYWPLKLDELNPESLKKLLDDARIRRRVIVVSACFSGGFVEPLKGPNTLVLTAADATHASFGCGTESDFTYFAKALFDEQLRETFSFEEAFARAVPVIKEREQAAQQEHSNPQIAAGEEIRKHWTQIERRLRALARR